MLKFDVLVIGSGIAGLSYAIKIANRYPKKSVAIVSKSDESESNTKYAQGGIASIFDSERDSIEEHIQDTLKAGDGLCDPKIVKIVVSEGPLRILELIELGIDFDKKEEKKFDLAKEGGHSQHRILHHKDITGLEIERKLLSKIYSSQNIEVFTGHFAVDLITEHHLNTSSPISDFTCFGAYVFNSEKDQIEIFSASITLLATGGIGQVYRNTTNPAIATGDGIAMAYRAKAQIKHMEFIQFHPTAVYEVENNERSFLISEAVRGFGALIRNKNGERFMHHYDDREELASRDIVSRAIDSELKKNGDDYVLLDCRHLDHKAFGIHFPNITKKCEVLGIDLSKQMIPVIPTAHYLCGGVVVNEFGQTSLGRLFACGECTFTGLHGANRLASNSLLEAVVFAERCFQQSIQELNGNIILPEIPEWNDEGASKPKELVLITHNRKELQSIMSDYVGIVRSNERLERANNRLKLLYQETEKLYKTSKLTPQLFELRNLITVAYLIVQQSIARRENRGGYYNIDLA